MWLIRKMTVGYDEQEDRLSLDCEDNNGEVARLWLTQRLMNRLVAFLLTRLDQTLDGVGMARNVVQAWEQSAAQAQMAPSPPVTPPAQGTPSTLHPKQTPRLVNAVDIGHDGTRFTLLFRGPQLEMPMTLETTALRQWLGILHQHYRQAEWPLTIWPAWIEGDATTIMGASGSGVVLH